MASSRSVSVGGLIIGGGAPVSIQSMCNADPHRPDLVAQQVHELAAAGCDIVRITVPTLEHIAAAKEVRKLTVGIPLVADVHFDHRVAIELCGIVDKIRINPGTLNKPGAVVQLAAALRESGTPVRIGSNSGSLPDDIRKSDMDPAEKLVAAVERQVCEFMDLGVNDIVISVKSSSPAIAIKAYELAASRFDLPLHLGVTEAGTATSGAIRSATVFGSLLGRNIGDTIRVSLAGSPIPEVRAAREILAALGIRKPGIQVRACPTCGRAGIDTGKIAETIENAVFKVLRPGNEDMVIAVMGCEVNGPGEARDATYSIVGTPTGAALYINGKVDLRGTVEMVTNSLISRLESRLL
jgi:(E)-4-hydroxy-3-methylbut-2-enyl-diphosphate synthase